MKRVNKLLDIFTRKIKKWIEALPLIINKQEFFNKFYDLCLKEVKGIKDCSEKSIVTFYIEEANNLVKQGLLVNGEGYDKLISITRSKLSNKYTSALTKDSNIIDIYFNDVKKEYIKHPMVESYETEFLPENREIFLKNNLKLVIDVAKRYVNLGVPFEDLIQAGNEGLCIAFNRFDTERANLRISIIKDINTLPDEHITYDDALMIICKNFTYSKDLEKTISKIPATGFGNKELFISWVKTNVKTAVFASVAFQWIRAYIIIEINKNGKVIRLPKSISEDEEDLDLYDDEHHIETDEYNRSNIIYLDSVNTYTNDCYHDNQIAGIANDNFLIEDKLINKIETENMYSNIIDELLSHLTAIEKRIIMKRFGIEYPYQLNPLEIAENEGLSTNKVKYILNTAIKKLSESVTPEQAKFIKDLMYN